MAEKKKHRWWRWGLGSVAALAVLIVLATGLIIRLQPVPPPLALPAAPASAPAGPLDGNWQVTAGSVAGFRVPESAFGFTNDTVGRTHAISGTVVISGGRVTSAVLRIGLTALTVNGKTQPQFTRSLGTREYPAAVFTLTRQVPLTASFATGAPLTATAAGRLAMHGTSRLVTCTLTGRRDGPVLQVAGSIPVMFSGWHIKGPASYGFAASLASHGVAEMLLILHRR